MMRKYLMTVAVLAFAGMSAQAVERTGWERPIERARMEVVKAQPSFNSVKDVELVMTKQDGSKEPTGFVLLIDGQQVHFEVMKKYVANCGDAGYEAIQELDRSRVSVDRYRLQVVNRTHRFCIGLGNVREHGWQVMLSDLNSNLMELAGDPQPMMTIQGF